MSGDYTECTERGDAILMVGTGAESKKIKVDTYILKAASEVFRVLFDPQWKDGEGLSRDRAKEIAFPEDNPGAMTIICEVLHHKFRVTRIGLAAETILDIARLTDKYMLQRALELPATCWLQPKKTDDPQKLMDLLHAAVLFDHPFAKTELIKSLALQHGESYNYLVREDVPQELHDLMSIISTRRTQIQHELNRFLFDALAYIPNDFSNTRCRCIADYSCQFYDYVRRNGLKPDSSLFTDPLVEPTLPLLRRLNILQAFPRPVDSHYRHTVGGGKAGCHRTPLDLYTFITDGLNKVVDFASRDL